jgi:hypothetical protein
MLTQLFPMRWSLAYLLVAVLALAPSVAPVRAADQVVSDCGDNGGTNQLRAKLTAAQSSGGGTITFACGPATITLTGGILPLITTNITIDGAGTITLSGNNISRLFIVANGGSLTLRRITLTKGYNGDSDGGAITNYGMLQVNTCRFLDNETADPYSGGAIATYGRLVIIDCEFARNKAGNGGVLFPINELAEVSIAGSNFHDNATKNTINGWGGAILVWGGATVHMGENTFSNNHARYGGAFYLTSNAKLNIPYNAVVSGNTASYEGGAMYNNGIVNLHYVTLDGNTAEQGGGGGISNFGSATLEAATLSGNSAYDGGGIANNTATATLTMTNVTLSGNSAVDTGGAIETSDSRATLTNVTLSGNSAPRGGGIFNNGGTMTLLNTLLAHGANGANCVNVTGGYFSFSLSDDISCSFGAGRDNLDLLLGPLAKNGSSMLTHLPLPGSPAIDAGTDYGTPAYDQRGIERPRDGNGDGIARCDIGAVEVQSTQERPKLYLPQVQR